MIKDCLEFLFGMIAFGIGVGIILICFALALKIMDKR